MIKNILFISYDGMTDPLGQSQVIPYLAGLTKYGYHFTILSCDKPDNYAAKKEYVRDLLKDLPIDWVSMPYHKNPPVLSSIYDLRALKQKAAALHRIKKFDMVHTRPGIPTLVAVWLKKKFKIKFLNDIRGFWADERVDGGMWKLSNPVFRSVYNYFKKHEYDCLELAEYNTCLTHVAKSEMLNWKVKYQPLKIEVIPCSADLKLFDPANIDIQKKETVQRELGITSNDFVVSYLGSIGGWYMTDEMLRFCKMLSDKIPATKFLFISPHRHEDIVAAAMKHGIAPERLITKKANRFEVPLLLSLSKYSLFFIKPCYSKLSSSPTKHGEIMAMGIPVITNSGVGDVEEIVEKYNAGFVLDNFSDESYNSIINQIAQEKSFSSQQIRQGAIEYYSLTKALEQYSFVYNHIFTKH